MGEAIERYETGLTDVGKYSLDIQALGAMVRCFAEANQLTGETNCYIVDVTRNYIKESTGFNVTYLENSTRWSEKISGIFAPTRYRISDKQYSRTKFWKRKLKRYKLLKRMVKCRK